MLDAQEWISTTLIGPIDPDRVRLCLVWVMICEESVNMGRNIIEGLLHLGYEFTNIQRIRSNDSMN